MEERNLGFIKLPRTILQWEWYEDANRSRIMIHCLLKANFTVKRWRGNTITPGEFITSMKTLSAELNIHPSTIRKSINHLEKSGYLKTRSTNKYTLIKICESILYKPIEITSYNQIDNQVTNTEIAREEQGTTTNNVKNYNNIKECKEIFKKQVFQFQNFDSATLKNFYDYWTEECEETGRLRFQQQKFWNLETRLNGWKSFKSATNKKNTLVKNR